MDDVMDRLFGEWHRLGAPVLLAEAPPEVPSRPVELLVAESTAQCRESGRLTWIVLAYLIDHIEGLDAAMLLEHSRALGDMSVFGILCDAARSRRPHPSFDQVISQCRPNVALEPFFDRVSRSPLATRIAQENPVDVFLRWNYLCSELQYLDDRSRRAA